MYFPHHEDPRRPLRNSIIDGELVIDTDSRTKQVCLFIIFIDATERNLTVNSQDTLRYLAFDCLVVDEQNVMSRPLDKRYGVCLS